MKLGKAVLTFDQEKIQVKFEPETVEISLDNIPLNEAAEIIISKWISMVVTVELEQTPPKYRIVDSKTNLNGQLIQCILEFY